MLPQTLERQKSKKPTYEFSWDKYFIGIKNGSIFTNFLECPTA